MGFFNVDHDAPCTEIYSVKELKKVWIQSYKLVLQFSSDPNAFTKTCSTICNINHTKNLYESIKYAFSRYDLNDKINRLLICVRIAWYREIFETQNIDLTLRDYGIGVWGVGRILDVRPDGNRKKIRFLVLTGKASGELIEKTIFGDKLIYYIAKSLGLKLRVKLDKPTYRDYRHPTDICGSFVLLFINSKGKKPNISQIVIPKSYSNYYLKILKNRYNKTGCVLHKSPHTACYLCPKTLYDCPLAVHCFFRKPGVCTVCQERSQHIDGKCLLCLWYK